MRWAMFCAGIVAGGAVTEILAGNSQRPGFGADPGKPVTQGFSDIWEYISSRFRGKDTTILEQDLFYSLYTLSEFSNTDKLLNSDDEKERLGLSAKYRLRWPDLRSGTRSA